MPKQIVSKSLVDQSSDSGDRSGTDVVTARKADHGRVGFNLVRTAWAAGDILFPIYTIAPGLVICLFCPFGILCLCRGRCGCWRLSGRGGGRFGSRSRICLNSAWRWRFRLWPGSGISLGGGRLQHAFAPGALDLGTKRLARYHQALLALGASDGGIF